jgi:peptidoglycan/xylan/chitin deacetylase (PgdA/CDA1 family)
LKKENLSVLSSGILVISLDFELYWGMRDKMTINEYGRNILGAHNAVKAMLNVFSEYDIHATWATVGFLFFENSDGIKGYMPEILPDYANTALSPYYGLDDIAKLNKDYLFAPRLIELIMEQKGQEIGTHTFSHYYCLEAGQSPEAFREDISSAVRIAKSKGIRLRSLVFPRNQWDRVCLSVLNEMGIACYRGNAGDWANRAVTEENDGSVRRIVRLIDSYFNLSGHHTYGPHEYLGEKPFNIPASRFLRPYAKGLSFLDPLRLKRITKSMEDAAMNRKVFHMWWHPHNFGINTDQNVVFLRNVLDYFCTLRKDYGMKSLNMGEVSDILEALRIS